MSRPKKRKPKRTIRISSHEWEFARRDSKVANGSFSFDGFGGRIFINTTNRSNRDILESILHEIVEGIITLDGRRWCEDKGHVLFAFDHDYLGELDGKILDAMISIGMVDPKKKVV